MSLASSMNLSPFTIEERSGEFRTGVPGTGALKCYSGSGENSARVLKTDLGSSIFTEFLRRFSRDISANRQGG